MHSFDVTEYLKIYVGSSNWTFLTFSLNAPWVHDKPRSAELSRNDSKFLEILYVFNDVVHLDGPLFKFRDSDGKDALPISQMLLASH